MGRGHQPQLSRTPPTPRREPPVLDQLKVRPATGKQEGPEVPAPAVTHEELSSSSFSQQQLQGVKRKLETLIKRDPTNVSTTPSLDTLQKLEQGLNEVPDEILDTQTRARYFGQSQQPPSVIDRVINFLAKLLRQLVDRMLGRMRGRYVSKKTLRRLAQKEAALQQQQKAAQQQAQRKR